VIHTGDSHTGRSTWDDERVFVFLHALPDAVHAVLFVVVSADGRPFSEVPGAFCHLSDLSTERELIHTDLSSLARQSMHGLAVALRTEQGWQLSRFQGSLDVVRRHERYGETERKHI
jgi:stress response protein SCP2